MELGQLRIFPEFNVPRDLFSDLLIEDRMIERRSSDTSGDRGRTADFGIRAAGGLGLSPAPPFKHAACARLELSNLLHDHLVGGRGKGWRSTRIRS